MISTRPRILLVASSGFNGVTGTGITFSNLFRGWPDDRLYAAYSDVVPAQFDVCQNFFRLGPKELSRWPGSRNVAPGYIQDRDTAVMRREAVASQSAGWKRALRRSLVGNTWPDVGRVSAELDSYIRAVQPQLIYTILGTMGFTQLALSISEAYNIPMAVHFMDDYMATLYSGGLLSPLIRSHLLRLTERAVRRASVNFAIGDMMAEAFSKRWSRPFIPVQNAVDVESVPVAQPLRDVQKPMRLAYIGSIFTYAQASSLADIAQAVAQLTAVGRPISLDIYSPLHLAESFRASLEISPAIQLHDTIREDAAFFKTLTEVDALVLPVNFDRGTVDYIRYSMPTKVPAYLASGTPILAYGPLETAQIAYAQREGWGIVVDKRDPQMLRDAILALSADNALRASLSKRAREVAIRHDIRNVRSLFQGILAGAAGMTGEGQSAGRAWSG
jgi:glycosyltransferase involved in cell wall biosynthesis